MDKSENNAPHTNNSRLSKINRELLVFLIFLFIAIAFWFIQTFKDSMSMSIDYQLKITGIPKSVITTSQIPETVNVRVYGRGFQLLRLLFSSQERVVEVDYSSMKDNNKALLIDNEIWKRAFDRILPSGISINERSLQTLEIFYSDGKHKAVKVLFDGKISTKSDFILCDVILTPNTVDVYAPQNTYDTISAIKTTQINYEDLEDTTTVNIKLDPPVGVKCEPDQIEAKICIDMLTSKQISVPIYTSNCPPNIVLKPFPNQASITFKVNASRLKSIKEDDFSAVIDYNEIKNESGSQCKVNLTSVPSDISNVQFSPQYVEYVIEPINDTGE